jgi:hypothetical protein
MRLFIKSDNTGNIISAGKMDAMPDDIDHPYADMAQGEVVIEVPLTPKLKGLLCHEISEQYTLDIANKKLKKKK